MPRSAKSARIRKREIGGGISAADLKNIHDIKKILRDNSISTVCEKAKCPNLYECFLKPTATFIILGNVCTRNCAFCAVQSRQPAPVNENEPYNVANAVKQLKLKHAVITSVTRDDLADKGTAHFAKTVREIKRLSPGVSVEVLTPDFKGRQDDIAELLDEKIDIFGHNIEMIRRLYPSLRSGADYDVSLSLLRKVAIDSNPPKVKTAVMLGLGETKAEVKELLCNVKDAGCDIIVIGQYMQPTLNNIAVKEYISGDDFKYYEIYAYSLGYSNVYSFPKARSSYATR